MKKAGPLILLAGAAAVAALAGGRKRGNGNGNGADTPDDDDDGKDTEGEQEEPEDQPPVDVQITKYPSEMPSEFPAYEGQAGKNYIFQLASALEDGLGILPGFGTFAMVAAKTESGWNNLRCLGEDPGFIYNGKKFSPAPDAVLPPVADLSTANTNSRNEARAAARSYYNNSNEPSKRYAQNDWPAEYWGWGSGGWFAHLPAVGLSAGRNMSKKNLFFEKACPFVVFLPIPSVIMYADHVRQNIYKVNDAVDKGTLPKSEATWRAVRRGMRGNEFLSDWKLTKQASQKSESNFMKALDASGVSRSFADQKVSYGSGKGYYKFPTPAVMYNYLIGL